MMVACWMKAAVTFGQKIDQFPVTDVAAAFAASLPGAPAPFAADAVREIWKLSGGRVSRSAGFDPRAGIRGG
jgi:hypothetical protein